MKISVADTSMNTSEAKSFYGMGSNFSHATFILQPIIYTRATKLYLIIDAHVHNYRKNMKIRWEKSYQSLILQLEDDMLYASC